MLICLLCPEWGQLTETPVPGGLNPGARVLVRLCSSSYNRAVEIPDAMTGPSLVRWPPLTARLLQGAAVARWQPQ